VQRNAHCSCRRQAPRPIAHESHAHLHTARPAALKLLLHEHIRTFEVLSTSVQFFCRRRPVQNSKGIRIAQPAVSLLIQFDQFIRNYKKQRYKANK
jgi:hypothetical protein